MSTRCSLSVENNQVDVERDDRTCFISWDQILRHEREHGENYPRSADHEQDWQPYPIDPYSAESADHACIVESSKHIS